MRGKFVPPILLAAGIAVLIGCTHDRPKLPPFKPKEEVVAVPDEPRFNNPPQAEYRPRVQTKDEKALLGSNNKMPGSPLSPGGF